MRSPRMPAASQRRSISRALFRTVLGPSSNRKPSPAQVVMHPPGRSEASRQRHREARALQPESRRQAADPGAEHHDVTSIGHLRHPTHAPLTLRTRQRLDEPRVGLDRGDAAHAHAQVAGHAAVEDIQLVEGLAVLADEGHGDEDHVLHALLRPGLEHVLHAGLEPLGGADLALPREDAPAGGARDETRRSLAHDQRPCRGEVHGVEGEVQARADVRDRGGDLCPGRGPARHREGQAVGREEDAASRGSGVQRGLHASAGPRGTPARPRRSAPRRPLPPKPRSSGSAVPR